MIIFIILLFFTTLFDQHIKCSNVSKKSHHLLNEEENSTSRKRRKTNNENIVGLIQSVNKNNTGIIDEEKNQNINKIPSTSVSRLVEENFDTTFKKLILWWTKYSLYRTDWSGQVIKLLENLNHHIDNLLPLCCKENQYIEKNCANLEHIQEAFNLVNNTFPHVWKDLYPNTPSIYKNNVSTIAHLFIGGCIDTFINSYHKLQIDKKLLIEIFIKNILLDALKSNLLPCQILPLQIIYPILATLYKITDVTFSLSSTQKAQIYDAIQPLYPCSSDETKKIEAKKLIEKRIAWIANNYKINIILL